MSYGGWLAIKVPKIVDEESGTPAEKAVSEIKGVKKVAVYPAQHALGVQFDTKGDLTSQQLIDALKQAGFEATPF